MRGSQLREVEGLDHADLGRRLVEGVARDGDHGQAAVVELLELHVALPRRVLSRVEPERVEAEVAREVVGGLGDLQAIQLDGGREDQHADPVERGDLVQAAVEDRRDAGERLGALVAAVGAALHQQVRLAERLGDWALELLGDRPAYSSEHSKAAMLEFGFPIVLEDINVLQEDTWYVSYQ